MLFHKKFILGYRVIECKKEMDDGDKGLRHPA